MKKNRDKATATMTGFVLVHNYISSDIWISDTLIKRVNILYIEISIQRLIYSFSKNFCTLIESCTICLLFTCISTALARIADKHSPPQSFSHHNIFHCSKKKYR